MPSQSPKVIISEQLDDAAAQWLSEHARVKWVSHDAPDFAGELRDAEGLVVRTYTQVDASLLAGAPMLRVVGRAGVGLDNIDLPACAQRGVRVVHTPDANTQAVVEYVFALITDALRPRCYLDAPVSADQFHALRKTHVGAQLDTLTLGVLGVGRIGRRVAHVARAFGIPVICHDLLSCEQLGLAGADVGRFVDLSTLCAESDILTIHIDGRPSNRHLFAADLLARLKPTCLLINAARGMLIDHAALADWARHVESSGGMAILDVHDPEPPATDYPLFGLVNVRLLPHLASRTPQAMANMSWVVRDVVRVLQGEQPRWSAKISQPPSRSTCILPLDRTTVRGGLAMTTQTQNITAEQLPRLAAGRRCELIRGELIMVTPASCEHGRIAGKLFGLVRQFAEQQQLGETFAAETGFIIQRDPDTVRAADVAFVRREQAERLVGTRGYAAVAPDLIIEVVSAADREEDVLDKIDMCLAAGVRLAWIVWPATRSVTVHQANQPVAYLHDRDQLTGDDVLPGFTCPIADIFN